MAIFATDGAMMRGVVLEGWGKVPTRNVNLTAEQDEFVESIVRAGEYQNASEAIRDALRALQQRRREDALKLERLRLQIQAGIDDLESGQIIEVDEGDLEDYLANLGIEQSPSR